MAFCLKCAAEGAYQAHQIDLYDRPSGRVGGSGERSPARGFFAAEFQFENFNMRIQCEESSRKNEHTIGASKSIK